jgi:hypothetical protein
MRRLGEGGDGGELAEGVAVVVMTRRRMGGKLGVRRRRRKRRRSTAATPLQTMTMHSGVLIECSSRGMACRCVLRIDGPCDQANGSRRTRSILG